MCRAEWLAALLMAMLVATPARAQVDLDRASLQGTVRDATGGALPTAAITITSLATAAIRGVAADDQGFYLAPALPPGIYQVRVELAGFAPKVFPDVVLTVGQRAELNVTLDLAPNETVVIVTGSAPLLEPTRVAQGTTLSLTEIETLPINQRDFLGFALLTPGAGGANPLATPTPTNSPTSGLSFSGQDPRSNVVTIDGADNMDAAVNAVRSTLSQDAVQEFQVLRSSFSAEFGRARAGAINIVSKSGSNMRQGSAFVFFRDDALDARNAFAFDLAGRPADPPFQRYQYGLTLGGPLAPNRAFYFASYEGLRRRESAFVNILHSDAPLRASPSQQRLFDALAASGVPALGAIAAAFVHPATGVLNTTRLTFPGTLDRLERETGVFPFASDAHSGSLRLDANLSARSQLTARLNLSDAAVEGNDVGGLRAVSSGTNSDTRNFAAVVSTTRVLSDASVNILRGQYGRFHTAVTPSDAAGPGVVIAGLAQLGRDLYNPTDYAWNIAQAGDTLLWSRGRQQWRVGADLLHMRSNDATAETFLAGQFTFAEAIPLAAVLDALLGPGSADGLGAALGAPASSGGLGRPDLIPDLTAPISALQSYNLGLPVVYVQGFGNPRTNIRYTQLGLFVQDEIRLGAATTLNVGVRYDLEWRDPAINVAEGPAPFVLRESTIADRNNVAPRLGVAHTLGRDRRTVVRGGWGLFYQNALQVAGFSTRVLSGQISQVFLPLTGLPGLTATSADVWRRYVSDGRVDASTLQALGVAPGVTPSILLAGREDTPNAVSAHASAGIERELAPDLTVGAEYTYNRGRQILRLRDINVRAVGDNQFALPGLDPRFVQLNVFEASGRSSYHGLSVSVRKRYARSWSLLGSYTLGRARDDVTDFTLETQPQDQTDLAAEWGRSTYDQRHQLVASAVFASGEGAGTPWLRRWTIAPIVTYASGRPFTPVLGYDGNGDSHAETDRARLADGTSAARNAGTGPSLFTIDLRAARQFAAGPRRQLELTFEAFNLLNRINYAGVNRVFGSQPLPEGRIEGRADLGPTQPLGFSAALPARQVQLGVRLRF